jgi:hypothetical protein
MDKPTQPKISAFIAMQLGMIYRFGKVSFLIAKRLECGQLAAAIDTLRRSKSGGKPRALQTLRASLVAASRAVPLR